MRKRLALLLTCLLILFGFAGPAAVASPADDYVGPYFGDGNLPPGCIKDMSPTNPANECYHMKLGLNGLDSPQVDVAVLVPVSPTVERDMRIMRQAVQMWEGGIDYLADEMGMPWLADGVDFHVTVDAIDLTGDNGGEFTTYPLVDPEIVVIATNPVGGIGIGIDPVWFAGELEITDPNMVPCTTIENPFDFEAWENVPGFNSHHDERSGTYVEDCGGAGGNVCFAVNGAIDPVPGVTDVFGLYDLVSHEFGHCMTVGHVGDGADGPWGPTPTNDIMAYSTDPVGINKCVSTLDVEGVATTMSHYLDVNGDGAVNQSDHLHPNDVAGDGSNPFQVQHPDHHLYASGTGSPLDCPQPDLGTLPGEPTDWTPEPVATSTPVLTVATPSQGAETADGTVQVTGTVEHQPIEPAPASTQSSSQSSTESSSPSSSQLPVAPLAAAQASTVTFEHEGGNTFTPLDSSLGLLSLFNDTSHHFDLSVPQRSDVEFLLTWDDPTGSDLDLSATGAAASGSQGATSRHPETFVLKDVQGDLQITVDPYLIAAITTTYELTATIRPLTADGDGDGVVDGDDRCPSVPGPAPSGCPDRDGDGVADQVDVCPDQPGAGADGCPVPITEHVRVYVDGVLAGSQDIDTSRGPDTFAVTVTVPTGTHDVRIDWEDRGEVIASATRTVTRPTPVTAPDSDGDGVADATDNCVNHPNANQSNIDGDGKGDACDADMDGDGHSNGKEQAQGTDPRDPASYPGKKKGGAAGL